MNKLFEQRKLYNLRSQTDFITQRINNGLKFVTLHQLVLETLEVQENYIHHTGYAISHILGTSHSEVLW